MFGSKENTWAKERMMYEQELRKLKEDNEELNRG